MARTRNRSFDRGTHAARENKIRGLQYNSLGSWAQTLKPKISASLGPPVVPFLTPFLVGRVPLLK